MDDLDRFALLASALGIGLLVGLERGWHERGAAEGTRIAGVRTFGLLGLLGGLAGLAAPELGPLLVPAVILATGGLMAVAHLKLKLEGGDIGVTTVVAALVTVTLGAVAASGHALPAAAAAVMTAFLLNLKPVLHRWVAALSEAEIGALLRFLVISLVVLPVLPDRGFGPYGALNPYAIWWMVVLIAGLSFAGYLAVKVAGPRQGLPLTGLLGGLVSSTAATATLARVGPERPTAAPALAAGILLASTVMAVRVIVIATVIDPATGLALAWPLGLMALAGLGLALLSWWQQAGASGEASAAVANPLDLPVAIRFGLLLAAILVLSRVVQAEAGDWGLYALGVVSGLADVDAITLSLSRQAAEGAALAPLVRAILIAVAANTLVKAGIAIGAGGGALARRAGLGFALMLGALAAGALLPPPF